MAATRQLCSLALVEPPSSAPPELHERSRAKSIGPEPYSVLVQPATIPACWLPANACHENGIYSYYYAQIGFDKSATQLKCTPGINALALWISSIVGTMYIVHTNNGSIFKWTDTLGQSENYTLPVRSRPIILHRVRSPHHGCCS